MKELVMMLNNLMDVNQLLRHIEEGVVSQRQHPTLPLRILNYTQKATFDRIWDEVTVQCRGLIVDDNNQIISRCMPKFWNLGQEGFLLGVNQDTVVDSDYLLRCAKEWGSRLTITRKMDGQMGVLWNYSGEWGISTRGSFESDGAKFATAKFQKFVKYGATAFIPKGWTLIWELIDEKLRIVIPYTWSGLCLLTAVNNETGEEMSYEQLHELWTNLNSYSQSGKPWCRIVEKFDIDISTAVADPSLEEEGYVVSVNHAGHPALKSKVKLAEYCRLHKILTGITPQMIWAELANPMDPWLVTDTKYNRKTGETTHTMNVPSEFAAWVKQWQRGLTKAFHGNLVKAVAASDAVTWEGTRRLFKNDVERKDYLTTQGYERDIVTAALLLYNGREAEAYEGLWKLVRPFGRDNRFYVEGKGE
jgi:RNA ligase